MEPHLKLTCKREKCLDEIGFVTEYSDGFAVGILYLIAYDVRV